MQNEFSAARFGRMRGANDTADRIRGCLFGGAVGDALGYPAEFLSYEQIRERFGKDAPGWEQVQDLIGVLLLQEMMCRRKTNRRRYTPVKVIDTLSKR